MKITLDTLDRSDLNELIKAMKPGDCLSIDTINIRSLDRWYDLEISDVDFIAQFFSVNNLLYTLVLCINFID